MLGAFAAAGLALMAPAPRLPVIARPLLGAVSPVLARPGLGAVPRMSLVPTEPTVAEENVRLRETNEKLAAENARLQATIDDISNDILKAETLRRVARKSVLNNIGAINLFVILTFGLGIGYSLLETDIRAVAALYYFDLGPDLYPGFARATVALDLFLRLPGELLHNYEQLVPTNPVFYKACTSGVAYIFGDFISQIFQGRSLDTLDLPRTFRSGAAGFIGHGPLCHYWMLTMEQYLDFGGAWWATGFKVIADQTVWSLYLNAMYSFLIGTLAFRDPRQVWTDVKTTSWPALRSSWRFWPFVHCISFSHAVPIDLKLLWVDVRARHRPTQSTGPSRAPPPTFIPPAAGRLSFYHLGVPRPLGPLHLCPFHSPHHPSPPLRFPLLSRSPLLVGYGDRMGHHPLSRRQPG